MFDATTPQKLVDNVRSRTDEETYETIGIPALVEWFNNELTTLWQRCVVANKNAFTKFATGRIASGQQSVSLVASAPTGWALTDFGFARGVDYDAGVNQWTRCLPCASVNRDFNSRIAYQFFGETLTVFPADVAPAYALRVWYTTKAPVLLSTTQGLSASVMLPTNGDNFLIEGVAAKIRGRKDEGTGDELKAQERAWSDIESMLKSAAAGQRQVADVHDSDASYGLYGGFGLF